MEADMIQAAVVYAIVSAMVLFGCAVPDKSHATDKTAEQGTDRLTMSYSWYDGRQERRVWLNPHQIAELNPQPSSEGTLKSVYSEAREVPGPRGIRLWEVSKNAKLDAILNRAKSRDSSAVYTQVLHDGPSAYAPLRLAPGNVIVHLDPAWSEAQIEQWAAGHKLQIVRKFEAGPNTPNVVVVKTGPGLDALLMANQLYESETVVAAFPDWWTPMVTK
jgi:hypothetical protein